MNFRRNESGQMLVFMALSMTIIIGFVAMGVDCGMFFRTKRQLQIAADAAAIAGALDYLYHQSNSSAQSAGAGAAQTNGYGSGTSGTAASDGSVATINTPPTSGPATTTGYVQAIVSTPNPTYFMRLFGFNSVNIAATAVAGTPTYGNACIWAMASSGTGMFLKGSGTINAPDCGVYVNSPDSGALSITGNKACVSAEFVDVVGNHTGNKTTLCQGSYTPNYGAAPRKSPWGNLGDPPCSQTYTVPSGGNITTSNQSSYQASSGSPVICFSNAVTLTDGVQLNGLTSGSDAVYVFKNGLSINGSVTVGSGSYTGTGVNTVFSSTTGATLDIAGGSFNQGNNVLNIYAPTYGSYNGISIMVPETNTYYNVPDNSSGNELTIQSGSSSQVLDGYIYAPYSEVYFQDSGNGVTASGLVGWQFDMNSGNKGFNIPSYDVANKTTTLNRVVTLVE